MIDLLYSIDVTIFFFINSTISNPVFDILMPFITDLNKQRPVLLFLFAWIIYLLWKGGRTARVTIGLLVVTVIFSDQFNSSILKDLFGRVRPCRTLDGVRMLVDCGGGLSFPSSHAVNNFAAATVIGHFYNKQGVYWFLFAGLVALSRSYVGVHYPSDILAGSLVGTAIGFGVVSIWDRLNKIISKLH